MIYDRLSIKIQAQIEKWNAKMLKNRGVLIEKLSFSAILKIADILITFEKNFPASLKV
jgi:hypothetical protein